MPTPPEITNTQASMTRSIIQRFFQVTISLLIYAILIFLSAGRLDWEMAWVFIGLSFFTLIINGITLMKKNPAVVAARAKRQVGTKQWDKIWAAIYLPATLLVYVIAGLDAGRYGWSRMPFWVQGVGIGLFFVSWLLTLWSLVSNPHFEVSVRIQEDRDHKAVSTGPYALVRHPGYLSFSLMGYANSLFLGSWWGLIPAGIVTILFIIRTVSEDRTLHEELPGYPEYAKNVRYRLLPGIW
jgi:protein-S-isoprenylcysteine O-methyltransferase Ste14